MSREILKCSWTSAHSVMLCGCLEKVIFVVVLACTNAVKLNKICILPFGVEILLQL